MFSMLMAEFQSIPHSSIWHFTFHLHSACSGLRSKHKPGYVSNTHACTYVQCTYPVQMQTHIDEGTYCIHTTNMPKGLHRLTNTHLQRDTHSTHSDVYQDRVMEHSGWAKQTYTHWLAPMGEAIGCPVWLLSLTSTSLLCKQTAAVWNTTSCCRSLKLLFHFNWFLCCVS